MKVKHVPGENVWTPFSIIISFNDEIETAHFYNELQQEIHSEQLRTLGSYIESCSEEQVQQNEQII